jgi:aspartyl-tRNA(Asn)/glutamyl-tRNA(Gln) amidotransferase subunit B
MRTSEEAYQYLTEVRKLVRYLDICDGNMEEGSLRCDANISVRLKGAPAFGVKVEVKNMNSIRNVQRAIDHEIKRQIEEIEAGNIITSDTRNFDATTGTTTLLRSKEKANDYRYFPEPDLPPVLVSEEYINKVHKAMPALPHELHHRFTQELGLSEYDAGVLTDTKEVALYFNSLVNETNNYKAAANWVMGPIKSYLNEQALDMEQFPLKTTAIAGLIKLIDDGKISYSVASQKIFPEMIVNPSLSAMDVAQQQNMMQESDSGALKTYAEQAIAKFPDKVAEYKSGKTGLLGLFMGEVMKLSGGKADPKMTSQIVKELLEN